METIAEQIALVGRRMFERRLTDMSGGNISAREGNNIYITPRFSGGKKHWQLEAEDIISGTIENNDILEHPMFSREGKAHLAIYRNFPDVTAVLHAHPLHVLPFCAAAKSIRPVLEGTQKFGVIECVEAAPAHTSNLAESIVEGFRGKEDRIRVQAAAVLLPYHGIIVAAKTLLLGIDALERIDWNAYCLIAGKQVEQLA
jgi:L-fuculose-phosphate aldolase